MNLMSIQAFVGLVVIVITAILYLFSRIRQNDMKILRESNKDLREAIDDKGSKITGLEHAVNTLEYKVGDLEKRNRTLEDLVVTALKQYFFENPTVANKLEKKII